MSIFDEKLKIVVSDVRKKFENNQIDLYVLANLYSRYAKIPDLNSFIERAQKLFPTGNCGLASIYLRSKLGFGKIIQGKYEDQNHTFLLIDENKEEIIDITADQFGGPKMYIGPLKSPWSVEKSETYPRY